MEALRIDQQMGTTFWRDALAKEMKNMMIAFEFIEHEKALIACKYIGYNLVFDLKITLNWKCWLVADIQNVHEQP